MYTYKEMNEAFHRGVARANHEAEEEAFKLLMARALARLEKTTPQWVEENIKEIQQRGGVLLMTAPSGALNQRVVQDLRIMGYVVALENNAYDNKNVDLVLKFGAGAG
jgi:hypothetical protein